MFSCTILVTVSLSAPGHGMSARCRRARPERRSSACCFGPDCRPSWASGPRVVKVVQLAFSIGAVIGFVGFNDVAFAAQRSETASAHGFPNAMRHEPSGLDRQCQACDGAGARSRPSCWSHQVESLSHLCERDMTALHPSVRIVTVKSLRHSFSAQRYRPGVGVA